jgi:hypothetical protein
MLNVVSIGRASQELHVNVQLVRRLADQLGIVPALTVDDVPHFHIGDVTRMRSELATSKEKH